MESTDAKLIKDYLLGSEASLEVLFSRYIDITYRFVFHYTNDKALAEDITQEAFVRAWRNLKKFDNSKNFKTWILAIAKHASIDILRKKKAIPFSAFDNASETNLLEETIPNDDLTAGEIFDREELRDTLNDALEQLPQHQKLVLKLHYYEQLTFREIAELLDASMDTIKSQHYRGVIALRGALSNNK